MLSSLRRSLPQLGRKWKPLNFSNLNFVRISEYHKIEEETLPDYVASQYYPTRIGEVIQERYQVVGKLGIGSTSTAWLARDMSGRRYVMLKIFIQASSMGEQVNDELKMYRRMEESPKGHRGRDAVRKLVDTFYIDGPEDKHRCLVHLPLWESVLTFLRRNPVERLPSAVISFVLRCLFLALDYLHTECRIIHTDIKADNIMLGINDDSVFRDFEEKELQRPVPREEVDNTGRTVYMSRDLRRPHDLGAPVLCDFGSAMTGDERHSVFAQPNIYRAPEVILGVPWTYSIDIWNVGCMGVRCLPGQDPEFQKYRSRAHLAEMINLLGPPPSSLIAQGELRGKFVSEEGDFRTGSLLKDKVVPIEERETTLQGQDEREAFLRMMRKMLQWGPEKRCSARELAKDEWIHMHM
ncbi:kinase-like protein [Aspergillus ellipticus CBS 707.79]|uniref:Kinase-like protein n=1 Tax=Aspergillus ellipticus CBS 707.79 TaxID=1448320 RepID=A0A319DMG3_9EURO|nr:kinase-like protein [Aspergillus ellipticus CBS 707.79]